MLNPNKPLNARIMQMAPNDQLARLPVMSAEDPIIMQKIASLELNRGGNEAPALNKITLPCSLQKTHR